MYINNINIAGVRRFIRQRLAIADNASPEEVAMAVKGSKYARDYFMSAGYIRHIRGQHEDIKYKRGVRDVDSVLLWVCTCTSSECFQWCLKIVDRKHEATLQDRTMSNRMALLASKFCILAWNFAVCASWQVKISRLFKAASFV